MVSRWVLHRARMQPRYVAAILKVAPFIERRRRKEDLRLEIPPPKTFYLNEQHTTYTTKMAIRKARRTVQDGVLDGSSSGALP
jgi:hypothetical protein